MPRGTLPLAAFAAWVRPSRGRGPTSPISTDPRSRGDRFSVSMPAPATSSHHPYTGHHQGHTQAAPWLGERPTGAPSSRRSRTSPDFDAVAHSCDASAVIHTRSSSRHITDGQYRALSATLTTSDLDRRRLRWFGFSPRRANSGARPPSLAQHGLCQWLPSPSRSGQNAPRHECGWVIAPL